MDSFEKYYTLALLQLSRRNRSVKEIRDYLTRKKASEQIIDAVITKLHEQRFQDDEGFARWWKESRTRFKSKSDRVIRLELRQKGISNELIEKIMSERTEESKTDYEKALELARKYSKKVAQLPRQDQYRRIGSFLSRRGFDYDTIRRVIDDVL
jgi:regulatory protein